MERQLLLLTAGKPSLTIRLHAQKTHAKHTSAAAIPSVTLEVHVAFRNTTRTHIHTESLAEPDETAWLLRSFHSQRNAWRCIHTHTRTDTHTCIKIHPPTQMHVHMLMVCCHEPETSALIPPDSNEINPQCAKASVCVCVCVCEFVVCCVCMTDMLRA